MRLDITGRHVDVTTPLRQLITKRLQTLERVLNDAAVSAQAILSKEKYRCRVEMVVRAKGDHTLTGLGEGNSWPLAARMASQKIEQQAKKLKGKWDGRKRQTAKAVRSGKTSPTDVAADAAPRTRAPRARKTAARTATPASSSRNK